MKIGARGMPGVVFLKNVGLKMSKKCIMCNEENQDVSRYCHMCGFKFTDSAAEGEETPPKERKQRTRPVRMANPYYENRPRRHRKKSFSNNKIIFGVLILIIIAMFLYIIQGGSLNRDKGLSDSQRFQMMQQFQQNSGQNSGLDFNLKYK